MSVFCNDWQREGVCVCVCVWDLIWFDVGEIVWTRLISVRCICISAPGASHWSDFYLKKFFLSFSKYKKNKLCYKVDFVSESDFCLFYFIFISHKLTSVLTALNFTSSVCGMSDERNSFLKEMWKKYCIVEQCQFV